MKENLISIIIPVYNGEKFLKRCLDSIIKQSYEFWEVILIDDGSTDSTFNIANQYALKDCRIKVIKKENSGVSDSRNLGISKAKGNYITFIDSDDWLEKVCLEKLLETIQKYNVDVIKYNYYIIDDMYITKGIQNCEFTNKVWKNYDIHKNILKEFINGNIPAYVWSFFIKRDLLNNIDKFNTSLSMMEDTIFVIDLLLKTKSIYFLDECLYNYYININSASHASSNYIRNIKDVLLVNKLEIKMLKDKNILNNIEELCIISHVKIIENMIFDYAKKSPYKKFKMFLNKIFEIEDLNMLIEKSNLKNIVLYKRIPIILLFSKKTYLLYLYYCIKKVFSKIKYKSKIMKKAKGRLV